MDWMRWIAVIVFHLAYAYSIIDIYFSSPIEQGLESLQPLPSVERRTAARRVVLIVADGLRADTCFEFMGRDARYANKVVSGGGMATREAAYEAARLVWPRENTSFLREIVESRGGFGVSHTRVPTESRPGHVAIIGGFYEDVSAVTRGWRENPSDFDHVFNQSARTFAFGSPDITRMFAKLPISRQHSDSHAQSLGKHHITDFYYANEEEDFAAKDLSLLDTWVFDKVSSLLLASTEEFQLDGHLISRAEIEQDKVVFFLHLLGLDSNGHAHHPHGREYTQNMALVDRGVARIVDLFESRFQDNATAYVFTSDHGMSSRGSHGDGDPANTRTPLIAWGSGIQGPEASLHVEKLGTQKKKGEKRKYINTGFTKDEEDSFSTRWGLDHLKRKDIQQADIAPLMSVLLGIPVPVNSVGILPLDYLPFGIHRAQASILNTRQLLLQASAKEKRRKESSIVFREFHKLRDAERQIHQAEELVLQGDLKEAEEVCIKASETILEAIQYYQTYDRIFLMGIIVLGYLGWIGFILLTICESSSTTPYNSVTGTILSVLFFGLLFVTLFVTASPMQYYIYLSFPAFCWTRLLQYQSPKRFLWFMTSIIEPSMRVEMLLIAFGTQVMVLAYTYRELFFLLFICLGLWPLHALHNLTSIPLIYFRPSQGVASPPHASFVPFWLIQVCWFTLCFILGGFTLIPIDVNTSVLLMALGGVVASVTASVLCATLQTQPLVAVFQLTTLLCATATSILTDLSLQRKQGLPPMNQLFTWAFFISTFISLIIVQRADSRPLARFVSVFIALSTQGSLLNVNYESAFFAFLGLTLVLWCLIERAIMTNKASTEVQMVLEGAPSPFLTEKKTASLLSDDIRIAFMFVLFTHVAFFGTGNFASMSSFQISSTFRFTAIFSPFLMSALLIFKLLIPHFLVSSAVVVIMMERIATSSTNLNGERFFLLVLVLCDSMAAHLFFWVTDFGSWLEIGNSISQYGFISGQLIFLPIVITISYFLLLGAPSLDLLGDRPSSKRVD